MSLAAGVAKKM